MRRESTLGRTLWLVLLVLLCGYVVADFVRSPFVASSGSAAVRAPQMTLWVLGAEAGSEAGRVAQQAAASLELRGHTTAIKSLDGGSSQAVADFLAKQPRRRGADLLVVTGATLADLAHDRSDRLVPGASAQAALAQALLRRAAPVGALAFDPLALAVPSGSAIGSDSKFLAAMRRAPWSRLFAIADDTWSRTQLAALVARAGIDGHARFSVFPSGPEAAQGAEIGEANTVLATHGALLDELRDGRLRALPWPFDGGRAPRDWVGLVASPDLPRGALGALRRRLEELSDDPGWRRALRREGREPVREPALRLATMLGGKSRQAARLERLARWVESR